MGVIRRETAVPRLEGMHYGYVVLFFSMLNIAGSLGIGRFAYTMILPAMREGLGLHNTQMGLIGTIGFIGYLAMAIPGGVLAARFGPRVVIALALLSTGAGMMLMGTVGGVACAGLLMAVVGIGSAAGNAAGFAFAGSWFPGRSRGRATGVTLGGAGVGMVAVGLLVPVVLSGSGPDGWRWAWAWCGCITACLGILCWSFLRNRPEDMKLAPVGGPRAESRERGPGSWSAWKTLATSREMRRIYAVTLTLGFAYVIYGTFFGAYAEDELGLSEARAGALWSVVGFLSIFSGLIGGFLADRLGRQQAFTILFAALGTALLLMALGRTSLSLYLAVGLYGLCVWGFPVILAVWCGDLFGPRLAPAGVGFGIFFFAIGQALGPVAAGFLYDRTGSFTAPFLCGAAASALGILATWLRLGGPDHVAAAG